MSQNRFTDRAETLAPDRVQPFTDLSIVNELDVVEQDRGIAQRCGAYFRTLFESWAPLASPPVLAEARRVLA